MFTWESGSKNCENMSREEKEQKHGIVTISPNFKFGYTIIIGGDNNIKCLP